MLQMNVKHTETFCAHSNRGHATRSRTQVVTVTTLIFFRAMISMAGNLMRGVSVFTVAHVT